MQIPTRRSDKLPRPKIDTHITKEKLKELQDKLEHLLKIGRPQAAADVQRFGQFGDFSENAEYQIAKGKLRGINRRIDELKDMIAHAIIIEPNQNNYSVNIGHTIVAEVNGKQQIFQILGSAETNPISGVISHNSPIGKALMGHKVGDIVEVKLPNKTVLYKIISIE